MNERILTKNGGRFQHQSSHGDSALNWIFIPGGPGLGSEALLDLTELLRGKIPGSIWHFDLPNDGSNVLEDKPISNWRSTIFEAVTAFEKVILVAHSTPGMYVQTMPELEEHLQGLVLIGSAPDASWQKPFEEYCQNHKDSYISEAERAYLENPNNETLRKLLIASAKHCFVTEKSLNEGRELFARIPVNQDASDKSLKIFDSEHYLATWVPQKIMTLITTGAMDHITPIDLFKNKKIYNRENILMREIPGAGHYPWFENPAAVLNAFQEYLSSMKQ